LRQGLKRAKYLGVVECLVKEKYSSFGMNEILPSMI
jgi:hypothetical protein